MITLSLLALAALWFAVLHRYPALFIPRKSSRLAHDLGENWIEVLPDAHRYEEVAEMHQVA